MKTVLIKTSELIDCKHPVQYVIGKLRDKAFHISPFSGTALNGYTITTYYDDQINAYIYKEALDER